MHRRMVYSQPLGYWLCELGGIFQAVHIWPYESLSQRAEVRQALGQDQEWQQHFFSQFLQCAHVLNNSLLVLKPGTSLHTDFQSSPSAAYELIASAAPEGRTRPQSDQETLVGCFNTVYGNNDTEYRLLRYPDADTAFRHVRHRLDSGTSTAGY